MSDPRKFLEAKKAEILASAQQRAAEIERVAQEEAAEVDRDLADIERLTGVASKYGLALVATAYPTAAPLSVAPARKRRGGSLPDPNSVTARAMAESEAVIRELCRPVPLTELWGRVEARGVQLGGRHPSWQLSSILGHSPTLISTKRGWWIKGAPLPLPPLLIGGNGRAAAV
jgi:hypothetical protein